MKTLKAVAKALLEASAILAIVLLVGPDGKPWWTMPLTVLATVVLASTSYVRGLNHGYTDCRKILMPQDGTT